MHEYRIKFEVYDKHSNLTESDEVIVHADNFKDALKQTEDWLFKSLLKPGTWQGTHCEVIEVDGSRNEEDWV